MAEDSGQIQNDPLFLAMTRPAMLLGVTYSWFSVNGFIWTLYFINFSQFSVLIPGAILCHFIGFMLCSHEPRFIELFLTASKTNFKCTNRAFHGKTSSYDLY